MAKILLTVDVLESKDDKAYLVYDVNNEYPEVVGVARGIHYAVNNFVECFNNVGYVDHGQLMEITNDDVELTPRRTWRRRKPITLV